MIFIISGTMSAKFIERLQTLIGSNKIKFVTEVTEYELEFVFNNFKDSDALTVLALHENMMHADAKRYAKKYEDKFNIPVFMGEVWNLWQ